MKKSELTYEAVCAMPPAQLNQLVWDGATPELDSLAGWEFRGFNVAPVTALLGIRKFKKGFFRDPSQPELLQGYNVKVEQNGLLNPWVDKLRHGEPVRHALYQVYRVRSDERDNLYPNALMLNYGLGPNPPLDPSRVLRDYLVQVHKDNPDLLLGKAYTALGPLRLPSGFFVLERYNRGIE